MDGLPGADEQVVDPDLHAALCSHLDGRVKIKRSNHIYRTVKRNFFPLRRLDCKDLVVVLIVELHGLDVVKDGLEVSLQEMLTSDLY